MKKPTVTPERRKFLKEATRTAGGLVGLGLLLGLQQKQSLAREGVALRPPFAIEDDEKFAAACIRCGQCVQACPYDMLHLASLLSPMEAGTPYFIARDKPCEMCPDIPCAHACPSGALDRDAQDINESRMGLSVLLDHETCLNWQGLRCDVCYRVCPLIDKAITLEAIVTSVPVNTPCLFRPFILMLVPVVVNVKKLAYWKKRQSKYYQCLLLKVCWVNIIVWVGKKNRKQDILLLRTI